MILPVFGSYVIQVTHVGPLNIIHLNLNILFFARPILNI